LRPYVATGRRHSRHVAGALSRTQLTLYFTETHHGTVSWTNLENGLTMTEVINNVQKDLKVTNNGDGTLTVVFMVSGVHNVKGPTETSSGWTPGQSDSK
jgi:hypothetical protein